MIFRPSKLCISRTGWYFEHFSPSQAIKMLLIRCLESHQNLKSQKSIEKRVQALFEKNTGSAAPVETVNQMTRSKEKGEKRAHPQSTSLTSDLNEARLLESSRHLSAIVSSYFVSST